MVGWVQLHKNPICAQLSIRIGQECPMNLRKKYEIFFPGIQEVIDYMCIILSCTEFYTSVQLYMDFAN